MSTCPPEMEKALGKKFVNKPQMLQFLIKTWAQKFHPRIDPNYVYADFKKRKGIKSTTEFSEEQLDKYISSYFYSLKLETP